MPIVSCGFPNIEQLIQYGPTVRVRVGFDPNFRPVSGNLPDLPQEQIAALVDTGATLSCIDTSLIGSLDLPVVGEEDFSGIAGSSKHSMHLAQIRIADLAITLYGRFAAVDLFAGGMPHSVLLGRTFLQYFRMSYEGRTGNVIIENESEPIAVPPRRSQASSPRT